MHHHLDRPREGNWQSVGNWSTEEVPGSTDVACIGVEKTPKRLRHPPGLDRAGRRHPEGARKLAGSPDTEEPSEISELIVEFEGTVTGPATVKVAESFEWAHQSTMSGSGKTVLLAGASGAVTTGGGSGKQRGRADHQRNRRQRPHDELWLRRRRQPHQRQRPRGQRSDLDLQRHPRRENLHDPGQRDDHDRTRRRRQPDQKSPARPRRSHPGHHLRIRRTRPAGNRDRSAGTDGGLSNTTARAT